MILKFQLKLIIINSSPDVNYSQVEQHFSEDYIIFLFTFPANHITNVIRYTYVVLFQKEHFRSIHNSYQL